jgi:hypothetical protein
VRGDGKRKGGKKEEGGWMGRGGGGERFSKNIHLYTRRKGLLLHIALLKKISTFLGQNGTHFARCHFRAKKSKLSGPPLTMALVMDLPASKSLPYVHPWPSCPDPALLPPLSSGIATALTL